MVLVKIVLYCNEFAPKIAILYETTYFFNLNRAEMHLWMLVKSGGGSTHSELLTGFTLRQLSVKFTPRHFLT